MTPQGPTPRPVNATAADDGDEPIVATRRLGLGFRPFGGQARDGEAILGVLVGDALDDAAQLAEGTVWSGRSGSHT